MAKLIRNSQDLNNLMKQVAYKLLSKTRDEVYDVIDKSIKEYYLEYNPTIYERTYRFLNSLVKTVIKQRRNELWCEVKIDEDYLKYIYPYTGKFDPSYPHEHDYDGRFAMGIDVVNWANRQYPDDDPGGNHGYTRYSKRETGFWDGAIDELGDILKILRKNLIAQGIKVV